MADTMEDILHPGPATATDPAFPNAPGGWSVEAAETAAANENLELNDDHWEAIRALQEYFDKNDDQAINSRALHDALNEKFHIKGGIKYLYLLFPAGPIAQGCRIAGLQPPAGSVDRGFGSVQ
ncbi:MAG: TusE/DsrC/DsvC family sulfur relay protein [Gammaproteobacteria bacterium]|nr:TusE/DsrC/DsvC family sulfur relay protein [Gammaproteobacteria bacterium]